MLQINPYFVGQSHVYVADPSAMEKVYRSEGKYPMRTNADDKIDWILKQKGDQTFFTSQYVIMFAQIDFLLSEIRGFMNARNKVKAFIVSKWALFVFTLFCLFY